MKKKLISALIVSTIAQTAMAGNNPANGQWRPEQPASGTPSNQAPVLKNTVYTNIFGGEVAHETVTGSASNGSISVTAHADNTTWNSPMNASGGGYASTAKTYTWNWDPGPDDAPIVNKDVSMSINGNGSASVSASTSGSEIGDSASASSAIAASASGTVGGEEKVGMTVNSSTVSVSAYIESKETKTHYKIEASAEKNKGGGSVSGDVSRHEENTFTGTPTISKSIIISAAITASGNTNGVGTYTIGYNQTASGNAVADCASQGFFYGSSSSTGAVISTVNYSVSPSY